MARHDPHDSHDTDVLWSLARGTLAEAQEEVMHLRAQVHACPACARLLEQMQGATAALVERTPPRVAEETWGRVDREVLASAQRVLGSRGTGTGAGAHWLRWLLVGGVLTAASVLFIVRGRPLVAPQPRTVAERPAAPATEVVPEPAPPASASPKPALARVRLGSGREQSIGEGAALATLPKEEALLELRQARTLLLPDSALKLTEMNESRARLLLVRGTVAVAAHHGEPGAFIVTANNVDVIVTGTRFLVTCSDDVVEVAVTEGVVRVRTASDEQRLEAGKALTSRNGHWTVRSLTKKERGILARLDPARSPPRPTPPGDAPPAPPAADADPAREQRPASPAPPAPAVPAQEKPPQPSPEQKPGWRLPGLNEIPRSVTEHLPDGLQPKPSQTPNQDEYLVRKMEQLARSGNCPAALQRAEVWLQTHPSTPEDDAKQKTLRQTAQAVRDRCR